jgi:hypothetical protein
MFIWVFKNYGSFFFAGENLSGPFLPHTTLEYFYAIYISTTLKLRATRPYTSQLDIKALYYLEMGRQEIFFSFSSFPKTTNPKAALSTTKASEPYSSRPFPPLPKLVTPERFLSQLAVTGGYRLAVPTVFISPTETRLKTLYEPSLIPLTLKPSASTAPPQNTSPASYALADHSPKESPSW